MPLPTPSTIPQLTPWTGGAIPGDTLIEISRNPGSFGARADQLLPGVLPGAGMPIDSGLAYNDGSASSGYWSSAAMACDAQAAFNPNSINGAAIYYPYFASRTATLSKIGACMLSATGAGNKLFRVALYDSTSAADPYPSTLIVDSGDLTTDNAGFTYTVLSHTLGSPVTLLQGHWYWMAYQPNQASIDANTGSLPGIAVSQLLSPYGRHPDQFKGASGVVSGFVLANTYGPFAGTFPSGKTPVSTSSYARAPDSFFMQAIVPEILLQFSA